VNVYLVGMPGSGKSTVGRELALVLKLPFVDLDGEVELVENRSIPEIFERDGESGFRLAESRALAIVAVAQDAVVACGGGIVLDPANRALLTSTGTVVYLHAGLETLRRRLETGAPRPLLAEEDDLPRLLRERSHLYRETASHVVNADGTARAVAEAIHEAIG
jgi:shikimate kinase